MDHVVADASYVALSWTQGLNSQADICHYPTGPLCSQGSLSQMCSAWAQAVMPALKELRQEDGKSQARFYFKGVEWGKPGDRNMGGH